MDMSSLFPSEAATPGSGDAMNPHVSFRAGILNRDPTTNQVTADPRPGTLQLITLPDDELLHLQWRPRNTSSTSSSTPPEASAEHDYIIFVGQASFKQVTSCPSAARVYVLKWREEDTRLFFWMQEKNPQMDAIYVNTMNAVLDNGPPQRIQLAPYNPDTSPATPFATSEPPTATNNPVTTGTPGSQNQQQERQTEQQPSTQATPAETASRSSAPPAEGPLSDAALAQLRTLLVPSNSVNSSSAAGLSAGSGTDRDAALAAALHQRQQQLREVQMTTPTPLDLLHIDVLRPALSDPAVAAALPALLAEHAPPADRHPARLPDLLRSPALRAQAAAAASALTSGPADGLLRQFNLDGGQDDMEPFGARRLLNALRALESRSKPAGEDDRDTSSSKQDQ